MNKNLKRAVAGILAVILVSGPALFGFVTPVQAGAMDCLAGIIAGKAKALTGAVLGIVAVPVADRATLNATSDVAGQTTGQTIKRCIIEPLVTIMARSLLSNFTAQTVKWINSGFKGSPLYVTNLQGFMTGVADQAVGSFIEGLGSIGKILCSPFDFQLRLALSLQYSSGYVQEIGCRLSDIQQHVQQAFTGGKFGKDGWNNWLQLTSQPQNNIYGAFLRASDTIDGRIANQVNDQITKLNWGKGFLSATDAKGNIVTPGTVIEDQLNKTLAQPLQNIGLAKDIDAILGALVGQMINQVMGGLGGLAGASKTPSNGGRSAVDRNINRTVASIIAENNQTLPDGILTVGQSPDNFCRDFKNNVYSADRGSATALSNQSKIYIRSATVGTNGKYSYSPLLKNNTAQTQWTLADYNAVVTFCKNQPYKSVLDAGTSEFMGQLGVGADSGITNETSGAGAEIKPQEQVGNIALNKYAEQSSRHPSGYPPARAVDGSEDGDYASSYTGNESNPWWQVDLSTDNNRSNHYTIEEISEIVIIPTPSYFGNEYLYIGKNKFDASADKKDLKKASDFVAGPLNPPSNGVITIKIPPEKIGVIKGPYIRIQREGSGYLSLREVKVFGKELVGDVNAPASGPAEPVRSPIRVTVTPPQTSQITLSKSAAVDQNDPTVTVLNDLTLQAQFSLHSQTQSIIPNLNAKIKLLKLTTGEPVLADIRKTLSEAIFNTAIEGNFMSVILSDSPRLGLAQTTGHYEDYLFLFENKGSKDMVVRETLKIKMATAEIGSYQLVVDLKDPNLPEASPVASWTINFVIAL